jgi:hypothetical protein
MEGSAPWVPQPAERSAETGNWSIGVGWCLRCTPVRSTRETSAAQMIPIQRFV